MAFKRNSKLISGALEKPGFYPIIGAVTLEDLISISGGLLPGADLENVTIREYGNNNGVNVFFYPEYLLTKVEECHARTLRRNGRYMCRFINRARIDPYGNVIHCGQLRKSFGNLKEKSFKEIWNSIEYKEFRMNLLNHNLMPICETCLNMVKIN